jgi:hypothetical protein
MKCWYCNRKQPPIESVAEMKPVEDLPGWLKYPECGATASTREIPKKEAKEKEEATA